MPILNLTPFETNTVPPLSQIEPKCATCKKFPVCNIREDYLKVATLIQNILGGPQINLELEVIEDTNLPYAGYEFRKKEITFPEEITTDKEKEGIFLSAKWRSPQIVQFIYVIEKFYVKFDAFWNQEQENFIISEGVELYYNLSYNLSVSSTDEIAEILKTWREGKIKEIDGANIDAINTTYFSATLNCQFYEKDKERYEKEKDLPDYTHIATYHLEPYNIKQYSINSYRQTVFYPYPYPYPVQKQEKKKAPSRKRDECCDV